MNEKFSTFTFFQGDYLKEFHPDNYSFKPEDVDFNRMYSDIALFMKLAVKNGYQMRVWSDEYCVVIEYNAQDESMSGVSLQWLDDNEYICEYEKCEEECCTD